MWYLAKGVGAIELCKLGEILGISSFDELNEAFNLVGEPLDEGPWPQTIHEGLIAKLTTITDAEIESVVPTWASIEEFRNTTTAESLLAYLKGLREFFAANNGPFFLVNAL
jgi:hypothetical protein